MKRWIEKHGSKRILHRSKSTAPKKELLDVNPDSSDVENYGFSDSGIRESDFEYKARPAGFEEAANRASLALKELLGISSLVQETVPPPTQIYKVASKSVDTPQPKNQALLDILLKGPTQSHRPRDLEQPRGDGKKLFQPQAKKSLSKTLRKKQSLLVFTFDVDRIMEAAFGS